MLDHSCCCLSMHLNIAHWTVYLTMLYFRYIFATFSTVLQNRQISDTLAHPLMECPHECLRCIKSRVKIKMPKSLACHEYLRQTEEVVWSYEDGVYSGLQAGAKMKGYREMHWKKSVGWILSASLRTSIRRPQAASWFFMFSLQNDVRKAWSLSFCRGGTSIFVLLLTQWQVILHGSLRTPQYSRTWWDEHYKHMRKHSCIFSQSKYVNSRRA